MTPPTGLVGWWPGEGNANDIVGTNNGTLFGGASFASGEVGQAFSFDGINGVIEVPSSPGLSFGTNAAMTVELWAYRTTQNAVAHILGKRVGCTLTDVNYEMVWDDANGLQFNSGLGVGALTGIQLPMRTWTHLAGTFETGTYKFYINGQLVATSTGQPLGATNSAPLKIGGSGDCALFGGLLDEVSIYNRALSASEIAAIYNAGSAGKCALAFITSQPQGQTAVVGSTVTFAVTAGGTPPLSYQWQFDSTNIAGATASSLTLTSVQPGQAGNYLVVVSNAWGVVTSSNAVLAVVAPPSCATPPAGLVGWWPGEGNANDIVSTNNGTLEGGASFVSGEVGQAFGFDGSTGYVQVPDSDLWAFGTNSFTVELWANFNAVPPGSLNDPQGGSFIGNDEGTGPMNKWMFALGGGLLHLSVYNPSGGQVWLVQAPFTPSPHQWYHLAVVRNGNVFTMFLNGVAVGSETNGIAVPNANAPLTIGHSEAFYFNGELDEVSIYSRALSASEIAAIYNAGSAGKCRVPFITAQPQGQTNNAGATVTFLVSTVDNPMGYQWQKNGTTLMDGGEISGSSTSTLTLMSITPNDAANYTVVITNSYGSVTSSVATLTVIQAIPAIITPPTASAITYGQTLASSILSGGVASIPGVFAFLITDLAPNAGITNVPVIFTPTATNNYTTAITNVNVIVDQATTTVNLNNLTQIYDGTAKPVSVATTPLGLDVLTTYNGSSAAPTNAGIYTVIGTIVDVNYQGSATNTLVIAQATATITLGGLYQNYDGAAKCANASTTPPGLSVSLTYNGSTTCPAAVGGYTVIGTVNDANYQGSTTNTLSIYAVAPVIVEHPQSQAVESGSNATLTVVATGAPLNYQWFEGGTALTGATASTLSFNPVALTNADIYFVVVSNSSGVAVSSNAVLAVRPLGAPIIRVDGDLVVGSVSLIGSASVTMESSYADGEIFYTLDGSAPDFGSVLYGGAIILTSNAVVRALGLNLDTFDSAEAPAVTVNILPTYGLILTTNGSGTVVADPFPGPYASNTVVTVTANPAAGWQFDYWTGDVSGNANPLVVTMDGPLNVQAVFVQVAYPVVATTVGGGSVSVSPVQENYLSNTVVSVTATASDGWTFLGWTGNASGTNNPLSLTVDAPESLAGVFGTTVNTSVIGGGIIELNATNPIPYGTIVRATGVPNDGSYFVLWGNALTGTNNPAEFTVTSTNPVHALFTTLPANSAALTVRINGEGDVSISPLKAYYAVGDNVTLNATPRGTTNQFVSWSGDFVSSTNPAILTLDTSKVVTANFSPLVLPPVITSSLTATGLVGTVFSYQITASNDPTSYGASGLPLGLLVNATNGLITGTPQTAGGFVVTISASNAGGTGSATLALGIGTPVYPPSIVQSPSDQTVSSGATVTFSVVATGTSPLAYQWRKDGFSLPGATNATLVLANVSSSDAAAYDVVVTNEYGSATSAVAQLTIYNAPAAQIFVVPTNGTSGQTIAVSVCLAALGNENALSFSLTFDPSLLSYQGVALGSGVSGGSLLANSSALGAGELGLGISLGTGASFSNSTQEIATVQFGLNPVSATTSAVLGFGDQPTVRLVAATNAVALASTFQGGNIVITPGEYLGDVFPPGVGDHVLDIRDWIREGFLVAGLETVTNQDEFLRADCAPLATKGDGILTVADWVQVGRFAVGLDPVTVVGDPPPGPHGQSPSTPTIWISSTNLVAGASVELAVLLDAVGNENAAGFSVSFDPTQLTLTSLIAGSGAGNATFLANTNRAAKGQAGVAVSLSSGGAWGEGSQELAVLGFTANAGGGGTVPVNLSDTVVQRDVADATAQSLTAVYTNGVISIITSPPQLNIALVGTNVTLSWPAALSNYVLQSAGNLGAGGWNTNLGSPSLKGTNLFMNLPATNRQQFYRLSQ